MCLNILYHHVKWIPFLLKACNNARISSWSMWCALSFSKPPSTMMLWIISLKLRSFGTSFLCREHHDKKFFSIIWSNKKGFSQDSKYKERYINNKLSENKNFFKCINKTISNKILTIWVIFPWRRNGIFILFY